MEILGALAIIAAIVAVVWFLARRPGGEPSPPPGPLTREQALEIVRANITINVGPGESAKQRYAREYPTAVVGEKYNQGSLRAIAEAHPERGRLRDSAECEVRAILIPEPDNPHDPNAVRVEVDGRKVGHLSRADARRYRSMLGLGQAPVAALIVGGWDRGADDRGDYGVRLAFTMNEEAR